MNISAHRKKLSIKFMLLTRIHLQILSMASQENISIVNAVTSTPERTKSSLHNTIHRNKKCNTDQG
jgi:hypothetical protein